MEDKIQSFRQPLVTATGIILGFILNFAANFVKSESNISDFFAYLIGTCVLLGIFLLITTLYRILRINYPREKGETYYQNTLKIFIFGISISFLGVLIDMFTTFMQE